MKDTVIKGTGNSRFLKSVENFKTLYPTYDAFVEALADGTLPIDFNGVNPDGITQLGTPLSMSSLLKHATAAVFGFGEEAVPDDVLRTLSRFQAGLGNEHIWKKSKELSAEVPAGYTLGEVQENVTIFKTNMDYDTIAWSEGSSVTVDDNGTASIENAGFVSASGENFSGSGFQGSFFKFVEGSPLDKDAIWYIPTDATINYGYPSYWYANVSKIQKVTGYPKIEAGTYVEYANSPHSYTYPPAEDDGFTYEYLGRFGEKVRGATGSYVGTGKYGSSNPNSLTFDFEPRFVIISNPYNQNVSADSDVAILHNFEPVPNDATTYAGFSRTGSSATLNLLNRSGVETITASNVAKWYSTSADRQLNRSGWVYRYMAIG